MSQPHKKFAKLRQWNRRRNYYLKSLRMRFAKLLWDYRSRAPFELNDIKKVLLLRDDGKIGDMVVSTSLFREFHSRGYIVDVLATPENVIIIENNPFIRKILTTNSNNLVDYLFKEQYDAVIDMGDKISPASLHFLR
ncbi:glycosyltransferase family 9 protein, partial [Buttiauxella noackiae]|uniref:glycosyltransferase family 9 protein n=1 Tax=Buttiauxella noackiae TaxID=82992 RepID=UPI000A4FF9A5